MVVVVRQVEGKIYFTKFDDLTGWTQEVYGTLWGPSSFLTGDFYSSPYSLAADTGYADGSSWPIAGSYVRRYRTITIPAGITTVRMQVRYSWTQRYPGDPPWDEIRRQVLLGSQTFLYAALVEDTELVWSFQNADVTTTPGSQVLKLGLYLDHQITTPDYMEWERCLFDDLVVARGSTITVKNLNVNWEARLYDASDVLIAGAHAVAGTATLDVSAVAYPITGRFKIYDATDVLQYTGPIKTDIYGGDQNLYGSGIYPLTLATDYFAINRAGMDPPTQAAITANLKDNAGDPVVGATISFSSTLGTPTPSSDTTDANGNAHTNLVAGASAGKAVVEAVYEGDPPNGISRVYNIIEIQILGGTNAPAAASGYDVWIGGQHISKYLSLQIPASQGDCLAEVELPEINTAVTEGQDLLIYQDSTKIFLGKIEVITKSLKPEPTTTVSGRTYLQHLVGIYIESVTYTSMTLKAIAEAVHATYIEPLKQVLLGTIEPALATITVTIELTDTTAYDVLLMVAKLGGVNLTVDENRYMHMK